MEEVLEHQGLAHDGVRAPALDVDHETDAAGIVLVDGVMQALGGRQAPRGVTSGPVIVTPSPWHQRASHN